MTQYDEVDANTEQSADARGAATPSGGGKAPPKSFRFQLSPTGMLTPAAAKTPVASVAGSERSCAPTQMPSAAAGTPVNSKAPNGISTCTSSAPTPSQPGIKLPGAAKITPATATATTPSTVQVAELTPGSQATPTGDMVDELSRSAVDDAVAQSLQQSFQESSKVSD